jgi:hypothetical protein
MPVEYFINERDINKKPRTTHLFLAEGEAEVGLIESCLKSLGTDPETCTILCFKGVNKMKGRAETFVKFLVPGIGDITNLRGVGLIADSDTNPSGRIDTVIECAKAFGFSRSGTDLRERGVHQDGNRVFAFSLSPSNLTQGRIEDIILQEVSNTPIMQCISNSLPCLGNATGTNIDTKAQVQMYISAKSNNSMAGLRHAFAAGMFDIQHPAYAVHMQTVTTVISA